MRPHRHPRSANEPKPQDRRLPEWVGMPCCPGTWLEGHRGHFNAVFGRSNGSERSRTRRWWRGLDSNQRRLSQRIYSPSPLATRAPLRSKQNTKQNNSFLIRKAFAFRLISPWFAVWFALCQSLFARRCSCFVFLGDKKPIIRQIAASLLWQSKSPQAVSLPPHSVRECEPCIYR